MVRADEPDYPGFCRVILARHAGEMTELDERERSRLMAVVFAVEEAVRATMRPDKVNLASLGNVVAHLHWHVVPRFRDDRHFPGAVWSAPRRAAPLPIERLQRARDLEACLRDRLGRLAP